MRKARAYLDDIRTGVQRQHDTDEAKVLGIMARIEEGGWSAVPRPLVLEDEGNGATVLDGHHRIEAAQRLGMHKIEAWVISVVDYCAIVDEHFGGYAPGRLADLDDHILVDGRPYDRGANEVEAHA
jgi:hypothetical protein